MPRQPRYDLPGYPQHVVQRGNNRQAVFHDEPDYTRYLDDLDEVAARCACLVHAYVLMTNHVHLLVTPMAPRGISRLMQGLGRRYVTYFNDRHRRSGTLWEGRYKASLVEEDAYLIACMRYIELNPVRARMVTRAADYKWSSHRCIALGRGGRVSLTHPNSFLALGRGLSECRSAYRRMFDGDVNVDEAERIREATNSCLVLGGDGFKARIGALSGQRVEKGTPGRPRKEEIAVRPQSMQDERW